MAKSKKSRFIHQRLFTFCTFLHCGGHYFCNDQFLLLRCALNIFSIVSRLHSFRSCRVGRGQPFFSIKRNSTRQDKLHRKQPTAHKVAIVPRRIVKTIISITFLNFVHISSILNLYGKKIFGYMFLFNSHEAARLEDFRLSPF